MKDTESPSALRFAPDEQLLTPSPELRARVAAALCEHAAPAVKRWYGPEALAQNLDERVASLFERALNLDLAHEYAKYFPLPGTLPGDYRNLAFELPELGLQLMTGIRFRALDVARPFVEIAWQSRPFRDEAELIEVTTRVARAYACMRPQFVQFFDSLSRPFDPRECTTVSVDRYLIAGLVCDVARGDGVQKLSEVSLRPVSPDEIYEAYTETYAAFHREKPFLAGDVQAESKQSLAECAEEGSLFGVLVSGTEAGVAALRKETSDGLAGYCVVELLLAAGFRGRGLAPAIHVQCCRLLSAAPGAALFGTIAGRNVPSLRTALRAGRQVVGGKLVVTPK